MNALIDNLHTFTPVPVPNYTDKSTFEREPAKLLFEREQNEAQVRSAEFMRNNAEKRVEVEKVSNEVELKKLEIELKKMELDHELELKRMEYDYELKLKDMEKAKEDLEREHELKVKEMDNEHELKLKKFV